MTTFGAIPQPPEPLTLPLPGGTSLTGMVELPAGASEQCKVAFNLMLQLGPIFANLECPLLVTLRAITWIIEFAQAVPDTITSLNPTTLVDKLDQLASEILPDLQKCYGFYIPIPLGLCPPIKAFLTLIRDFLQCLVNLMESILNQQLELQIQMGDAQGNPALLEVLELSQRNLENTFMQSVRSCQPAFDLLQTVGGLVAAVGGGAITVPSLGRLTGASEEIGPTIQVLKDLVTALTTVIDVLPC